MKKWKIIGLSGVTCGGKTSISTELLNRFPGSFIINQDNYYWEMDDPRHEWIDINDKKRHQNWESYNGIDWDMFENYVYNYINNNQPQNDTSLLIIEGHIIFNHKPFTDLCEKKFFLTLTEEQCRERRSLRSYIPNDPIGYFDVCIWPMYLKNKEEMEKLCNNIVYLNANDTIEKTIGIVINEMMN